MEWINRQYKHWIDHGELMPKAYCDRGEYVKKEYDEIDKMVDLVHDACGVLKEDEHEQRRSQMELDEDTDKFYKLLEKAQRELYPGWKKFRTILDVVRLMQRKVLNGWTNSSFDMLLKLLKEIIPEGETLPKSYYEAEKFNPALRFSYNKIDACSNECMLYWKDK